MITYDEAYQIGKIGLEEIDYCIENNNAYIFCSKKGEDQIGGCYAPCVVIKEDGKRMGMASYVLKYGGGKSLHNWKLDQNGKIMGELPLDEEDEFDDKDDDVGFYNEEE